MNDFPNLVKTEDVDCATCVNVSRTDTENSFFL